MDLRRLTAIGTAGAMMLGGCATTTTSGERAVGVGAGTGLFAFLVCKLSGGKSGTCAAIGAASGVAAGALTYAYLQQQMKEVAAIEGLEPELCEASREGYEAFCVTADEDTVRFASGSDQVPPSSYPVLDKFAGVLASNSETYVFVEAHTDLQGDPADNQMLSDRRASNVKRHLTDRGVGDDRIAAIGYGEDRPLVTPEKSPADRARNRRVEFRVEGGPEGDESIN